MNISCRLRRVIMDGGGAVDSETAAVLKIGGNIGSMDVWSINCRVSAGVSYFAGLSNDFVRVPTFSK